jgi:hypothetical protein
MIAETDALHPAERLVRQTMYGAGPKWLIEQLYYVSITEQTGTAKFINMAQSVLNTRYLSVFTSINHPFNPIPAFVGSLWL